MAPDYSMDWKSWQREFKKEKIPSLEDQIGEWVSSKPTVKEKDMALPAILPWVALGLEALGGFFSALGQEDPEFHAFDPELKDRYKEMRGIRTGQEEIMRSSVAAVDRIVHPRGEYRRHERGSREDVQQRLGDMPLSPDRLTELGMQPDEGPFSKGMFIAAKRNQAQPDTGQMLTDRLERRDRAKAQSDVAGKTDRMREMIKKERIRG
jgi:hypothetical protein